MRSILIGALIAATAHPAIAASGMEAKLRAHMAVLADDALQGRKPGTEGETKTLAYLTQQFAAAGFGPGGKDGSWYQRVGLVEREPRNASIGWAGGSIGNDELVLFGREPLVKLSTARLVYAGHGVVTPERDDLAGLDLEGAVVLMRVSAPPGVKAPPAAERVRLMHARRAAATILIYDSTTPFEKLRDSVRSGTATLGAVEQPPLSGYISQAAADRLLAAAKADPADLAQRSDAAGFHAVATDFPLTVFADTAVRSYDSYNVIARLPGRAPDGRAVLYMGHWDHLGLCRPEGAPDRICNGAVDNASGLAMMIEIARGLSKGRRPDRDMVMVATTAEEMGLLGAEAYAADPSVPLTDIVAAFNLDTVSIAPKGSPVAIMGRGLTPLDPAIDQVVRKLGRKVDKDLGEKDFLSRQDGWALHKRGVNAVMVGGSFSDMDRLMTYIRGPYHGPSDDMAQPLVLGGAAEDVTLNIALGRRFGDRKGWPIAKP